MNHDLSYLIFVSIKDTVTLISQAFSKIKLRLLQFYIYIQRNKWKIITIPLPHPQFFSPNSYSNKPYVDKIMKKNIYMKKHFKKQTLYRYKMIFFQFNGCHIPHDNLFSTCQHISINKHSITCVQVTRSLIICTYLNPRVYLNSLLYIRRGIPSGL